MDNSSILEEQDGIEDKNDDCNIKDTYSDKESINNQIVISR